ncbi:MAG: S8 family serine peptidase [Verrucomicrobiota bacterium]
MKNKRHQLYAIIFYITAFVIITLSIFLNNRLNCIERPLKEGRDTNEASRQLKWASHANKEDAGPGSYANSRNLANLPSVKSSSAQEHNFGQQSFKNPELLRMFNNARLIESRIKQDESTGHNIKSSLYEATFKYPFIKVKQTIEQGSGLILAEIASVADHVMVQVDPTLTKSQMQTIVASHGYRIRKKMFTAHSYLIEDTNASLDSLDNLLEALDPSKEEGIVIAEADYLVHSTLIPDDPYLAELWGLNNPGPPLWGVQDADIDAPEAWEISTGTKNVVVGVIDSGIDYNHPDLIDNMWRNPGEIPNNGIDDDGNGFIDDVHGWDFYNGDADPYDDHFHGTHSAGTIGAVGNNGKGLTGVCWSVSLMALKFLNSYNTGLNSDAADCISYTNLMKVDITSNSWGGPAASGMVTSAIHDARDQNSLFITAAGNNNLNNDTTAFFPASYNLDNIISVAATNSDDQMAWFSNYGPTSVDLAAPGSNIYSTFPTSYGFEYSYLSGTSMATPHVTGVCALILSVAPDMPYDQVKALVMDHVDPLPSLDGMTVTGGRLNAYNSLSNINEQPTFFIKGKVIATENATPISGAVVEYSGPSSGSTTTLADGTYSLNLSKGKYSLIVYADGFIQSASRSLRLPPNRSGINFSLERPDLEIAPSTIAATLNLGDQISQVIRLDNKGSERLTWNASIAPLHSAASSASEWIDLSSFKGKIRRGGIQEITLTLDATSLTPGSYTAEIVFSWDDVNGIIESRLPVKLSIIDSTRNDPPIVSFKRASSDLEIDEGYSLINIEAKASDPDGSISHVELFLDGESLGKQTKKPYRWNQGNLALRGLPAGTYQLKLMATDNEGATAEALVKLNVNEVNQPPTISFAGSSRLKVRKPYKPTDLEIKAKASDSDGQITAVRLYIDGLFVGEQNERSYFWNGNNGARLLGLPVGTYQLKLIAVDNNDATAIAVTELKVK